MKSDLPSLIVILGPTASGKTDLAMKLAKKFNGFIISADSRQVYRHMDIGTAKPSPEQTAVVHHEMIDIVEPDEPFTLADYQKRVFSCLETGYRSKIPFLVGGTGLYIDSIIRNWDIPKVAPNEDLRANLEKQVLNNLVKLLSTLDPVSVSSIDVNNKRRLIRAIEVAMTTGTSFLAQKKSRPLPYRVLKIGIALPKEELNTRVVQRVDRMMHNGLLEETKRLGKQFGWNVPAMSGLGYRQLGAYLRSEMSLEQAVERIKIETRQYAKRQMTWFKRDTEIVWIGNTAEAQKYTQDFLRRGNLDHIDRTS